jgi:hypothetical protein
VGNGHRFAATVVGAYSSDRVERRGHGKDFGHAMRVSRAP